MVVYYFKHTKNMWKTFDIDGKYFIFKIQSEEHNLKVTLSDLKSLWKEEISSTAILYRFKEINPAFECNGNIIESVHLMMENIDKALEKRSEWTDDTMVLNIRSELEKNYKIRFRFILKKLLQEELFSEVTLPMVQTVLYLEQSQSALHDLLKKKDRELQEYTLEKGEISRDDLKTQPFDYNANKNSCSGTLMLNLFNKHFLPGATFQNCCPEAGANKCKPDHQKTKEPLKRKIYSARNSNKRSAV